MKAVCSNCVFKLHCWRPDGSPTEADTCQAIKAMEHVAKGRPGRPDYCTIVLGGCKAEMDIAKLLVEAGSVAQDGDSMGKEVRYSEEEGWAGIPYTSGEYGVSKWHYFRTAQVNGALPKSLCGRFELYKLPTSGFEVGHDDSPSNCTECRWKLVKLKGGGVKNAL